MSIKRFSAKELAAVRGAPAAPVVQKPATAQQVQRLAQRQATAQAKADAMRGELELAVLAMREDGATLQELSDLIGMSRPGILKMLRRHEGGGR